MIQTEGVEAWRGKVDNQLGSLVETVTAVQALVES